MKSKIYKQKYDIELQFYYVENYKRYRNANHRTGTLWLADTRDPRLTGKWTGQQKASHGKRIPARKLVQEAHKN